MTAPRKKSAAFGGPGQPRHPLADIHLRPSDYGPRPASQKPCKAPRKRPWPAGCTIVFDTREQDPYRFEGHDERGTLATGDYSIKGMEHRVCVERKSYQDAWSSIGSGCGAAFEERRDCFEREWQRMAEMDRAFVVIESDLATLQQPNPRSQVHPSTVVGTYLRWSVRYGVAVLFAGDRTTGRHVTARLLIHYWELHWADCPTGEGE